MGRLAIGYPAGDLAVLLANTGRTLAVGMGRVDAPLSGGPLGASTYKLARFEFHAPSEHTVNGTHAAAELHLVHVHPVTGAVAVVGVLLTDGAVTAPGLQPIAAGTWLCVCVCVNACGFFLTSGNRLPLSVAALGGVTREDDEVKISIDLTALLPANVDDFWAYHVSGWSHCSRACNCNLTFDFFDAPLLAIRDRLPRPGATRQSSGSSCETRCPSHRPT